VKISENTDHKRDKTYTIPSVQNRFGIVILAVLAFMPFFVSQAINLRGQIEENHIKIGALNCTGCDYRVLSNSAIKYRPKFKNMDVEKFVTLRRGADFVFAFAGGYHNQNSDKNLLSYYDSFDVDGWVTLPSNNHQNHIIDGVEFSEKTLRRGEERLLVFYNYTIDEKWPANTTLKMKVYSALSRLQTGVAPASAIIVATRLTDNSDDARESLRQYLEAINIDEIFATKTSEENF
jgi:EpsI family protein